MTVVNIQELYLEDIGKFVHYDNDTNNSGRIKSYSNLQKVAWVVFKCNNDWDNYQNYTGESCKYSDLNFKC